MLESCARTTRGFAFLPSLERPTFVRPIVWNSTFQIGSTAPATDSTHSMSAGTHTAHTVTSLVTATPSPLQPTSQITCLINITGAIMSSNIRIVKFSRIEYQGQADCRHEGEHKRPAQQGSGSIPTPVMSSVFWIRMP